MRVVEVLTDDEVQRLLGQASGGSTGLRNRALLVLLYRGGLRVSEALGLMPAEVDLDAGLVRVLRGKGGRVRTVGLDGGAVSELRVWQERRASLGFNGRQPFLCTLEGGSVDRRYAWQWLKRAAKGAGIEKRVHPHGLRHTMASQLAAEGVPVPVIQAQLGHSRLATTDLYVSHLHPTAVVEAMHGRAWGEVKERTLEERVAELERTVAELTRRLGNGPT